MYDYTCETCWEDTSICKCDYLYIPHIKAGDVLQDGALMVVPVEPSDTQMKEGRDAILRWDDVSIEDLGTDNCHSTQQLISALLDATKAYRAMLNVLRTKDEE